MKDIPGRGSGERGVFYFNRETGKLQEKPIERRERKAPAFIPDDIAPVVTQADDSGQVFTSRSAYERHLREKGFTVKEKGMFDKLPPDPAARISPKEIREAAEKAYYDAKYGRVPQTEKEKEVCLREERTWKEYKRRRA